MQSRLLEILNLKPEPIAIYFTDEKPEEALQFEPGKRGCVASMMLAASEGKTAVFDEDTFGCSGGGVGLCFGDTFTKTNAPTDYLLSTGDEGAKSEGVELPRSLHIGERFFASPELARKWRSMLPYGEFPQKYVVFRPFSAVDDKTPPDLVVLFANPDQLSALVIHTGFSRGTGLNVIAPFGAACQSIVFAKNEIDQEMPKAIMGFFDISQRGRIAPDILSFTLPYRLFEEMESTADESCLTTHAWKSIEGR